MKRLPIAALLCLSLPAFAASDFQAGLQAYRNKDYGTAVAALSASAEAGDARAAQLLADMYASGRGVGVDPGVAFRWRQRAAEVGDPGAQFVIALQYLNGSGVPRNPGAAAFWLEKSAMQDHPNAALELGLMLLEGNGVTRNPPQGLTWIRRAADQGLFDAQQVLANVYQRGEAGVAKDADAASRWEGVAKQNAQVGRQINQSVMQQQDAIAVARNTYYYSPAYSYPWTYPTWGAGWGRYSGWNYGVGLGRVWW
jgi:hypothetical protein